MITLFMYIFIYAWNPNHPSFGAKRPCFLGGLTKTRGHLGSMYVFHEDIQSGSHHGEPDCDTARGLFPVGISAMIMKEDTQISGWF